MAVDVEDLQEQQQQAALRLRAVMEEAKLI